METLPGSGNSTNGIGNWELGPNSHWWIAVLTITPVTKANTSFTLGLNKEEV